jgi:hypothetical protein
VEDGKMKKLAVLAAILQMAGVSFAQKLGVTA